MKAAASMRSTDAFAPCVSVFWAAWGGRGAARGQGGPGAAREGGGGYRSYGWFDGKEQPGGARGDKETLGGATWNKRGQEEPAGARGCQKRLEGPG